jgi:nucleoside-diphosphate-sugar epimerase
VTLPGRGSYPLNIVPVDFVVRAARFLARHPAAVGGTFHLVDDRPLTARQLFDAVADAAGRPRPTVFLPGSLTRAMLNLPGIRGRVRNERTFIEWFDTDVEFDNRHARALLDEGGIQSPPVPSYIDALVRYVRENT